MMTLKLVFLKKPKNKVLTELIYGKPYQTQVKPALQLKN